MLVGVRAVLSGYLDPGVASCKIYNQFRFVVNLHLSDAGAAVTEAFGRHGTMLIGVRVALHASLAENNRYERHDLHGSSLLISTYRVSLLLLPQLVYGCMVDLGSAGKNFDGLNSPATDGVGQSMEVRSSMTERKRNSMKRSFLTFAVRLYASAVSLPLCGRRRGGVVKVKREVYVEKARLAKIRANWRSATFVP